MKKIFILLTIIFVFILGFKASAYDIKKDDTLYVSGESIGIKLNSGVEIVGTFGVTTTSKIVKPWIESGLKEGDKIIYYNNNEIDSISDLINSLKKSNGCESELRYLRNNLEYTTKITPAKTTDGYSLGLYIKDSTLGVGTLTYYLKEANIFGSLGHQMSNDNVSTGEIYEATVNSIILPQRNKAGEKKATISNSKIGSVTKNSITGVHGFASKINTARMKELHFKTRDEIRLGDAEIWTCIDGKKVERFNVKITDLKHQDKKDIKGISLEVVDENLIKAAGGIVQGMSGSPIVQDDMLIGAVTHVAIKDAKIAYGIYLEWMFEDMGIYVVD